MKKIDNIAEIHNLQFELLIYFDKICKENNLKYFLAGGTLLGAVRHNGFIPWDDDIDVSMPREDYEKLLKIFSSEHKNIKIISIEYSQNYIMPYAKMINKNYSNNANDHSAEEYGIDIDIFPIDALGKTYKEAEKNAKKIMILRRIFYQCVFKKNIIMKTLKNIKLPNLLYKKMLKILKKNKFEDSNYVGSIIGGLRQLDEIFEKNIYEDTLEILFEGKKFSGMKYYDEYLSKMYGDYMKLPPKEKQVPSHNVEIYDMRDELNIE